MNLGPFVVGDAIGMGGMGVIHAAVHQQLGTEVAVKIVTGGHNSESARSTFRDEVRAVAGLRHPHIVRVFDYGLLPESARAHGLEPGSPYLVMERAECTLSQRRRNENWTYVRGILLNLLDALAHAHARGIVHCDLKLSNILIDGVRPGLKLADFGIAQALGDGFRHVGLESKSAGTPTYMAPEQFAGNARDFGPGTDLYALGIIAWMLSVGSSPFPQRAWVPLMHAHTYDPLPQLKANRTFPHELEEWLGWMLEKDVRVRCSRAADAALALRTMRTPRFTMPAPAGTLGNDADTVPDPTAGGVTLVWSTSNLQIPEAKAPEPRPVPPIPVAWHRGKPPVTEAALAGVGRGLFGLRRAPIVGRSHIRDQLWQALTHAKRSPQFTLLVGTGGVGKTRLASWLCRRAHEVGAAVILHATHGPTPSSTDGIGAMFRRHLGCAGLTPDQAKSRLKRKLRVGSARASTLASILTPAESDRPSMGPHARFAIATVLLRRLATRRRVLVFLDDLQWSENTVAFLTFLLDSARAKDLPLHVVGTLRTPTAQPELQALMARPEVKRIEVGPLPVNEQEQLVRGLLGLDPAVAREVAERSEGVPLFAVELLRDWVDSGQLVPGSRGYVLRDGANKIPTDIAEIWERRLTGVLDADAAWQSLELAAVLGREVNVNEWHTVCAAANSPHDPALLERLLNAGLSRSTPDGWRFTHGMLHESLIRRADRAGRLEAHHALCAQHVRDEERKGLHQWGARAYESSVEQLLAGSRNRDILGERERSKWLLNRSLEALKRAGVPETDDRPHRIRTRLARCITRYDGDLAAAEALLIPAIKLARVHGWPWLSTAVMDLAVIHQHRGDLSTATTLIAESVATAPHTGHLQDVTRALIRQAQIAQDAGRVQQAIDIATQLIDTAERLGQHAILGHAYTTLSSAANRNGDAEAGIEWAKKALSHFKKAQDRVGVLDALLFLGCARWYAGDVEGAERDFREGLDLASLLGTWNILFFEINLSMIALRRGQFVEARVGFETTLEDVRGKRVHIEAVLNAFLVPAVAALEDWQAFDQHLQDADRLLAQTGFVDADIPKSLLQGADLARDCGHPERADLAKALGDREQRRLQGQT